MDVHPLLTAITPTILDVLAYFKDVKSSVWALTETLLTA